MNTINLDQVSQEYAYVRNAKKYQSYTKVVMSKADRREWLLAKYGDTFQIAKELFFPVPEPNWVREDMPDAIFFSTSNKKVNHAAKTNGYKLAVAYGKPSLMSCQNAGSCMTECYQLPSEDKYIASLGIHLHNYTMIYSESFWTILAQIENGIDLINAQYKTKKVDLIRLNDSGDFMSFDEVLAFAIFALLNPDIVVYGYTKTTQYLYRLAKVMNGHIPDNFRINISETDNPISNAFKAKLDQEYPNLFVYCYIVKSISEYYTKVVYNGVAWNSEELCAIDSQDDFAIGLHLVAGQVMDDDEKWAAWRMFEKMNAQGTLTC